MRAAAQGEPSAFPPEFDLPGSIRARAAACGVELDAQAPTMLATHARAVLRANQELHLTTIVEPEEFVQRHLGEAFEGAAMLPADIHGTLVDLGSGNGYPGIPLALARPGLELTMAEASVRKSRFLNSVLRDAGIPRADVLEGQVQRAADLELTGPIRVLATRAVGGWAKMLPKLAAALAPDGEILLWAGDGVGSVLGRVAWRRLALAERRALPGREASWIWRFRPAQGAVPEAPSRSR